MRKLHFINRIDNCNAGDWNCCPLDYYFDYFSQYNVIRHDIDYVDWNVINIDDVVIIGGSGMINVTASFNENINRLLEACSTVIGWSIGFNTHDDQWSNGTGFEEINFSKFKLISVRDYKHPSGLEYLPCPSGLFDGLKKNGESKRHYGVIEHKDLPIKTITGIDKISNAYSFEKITDFIATSDVILTNSYHVAYWTILMQKKCIVVDKFSTKFDWFKYPPAFIESGNEELTESALKRCEFDAVLYKDVRQEAIDMNNQFFLRVKGLIESLGIEKGSAYQTLYYMNKASLWNVADRLNEIKNLKREIVNLQHEIKEKHDEYYAVINAKHDEYYAAINAKYDELKREIEENKKFSFWRK